MDTKRAYLVKEKQFEIKKDDLKPLPNQVLVKVQLCGLCNWELNFWKGTGDYYRRYPLVVGHEWAGTVAEKGENVTAFEIGDKVTFLPGDFQGFAEYTVADEADCYKLKPETKLENAMGEPLKCIVTVLKNAKPTVGDFGLVLGCGPMGLWCIQALAGKLLGGLIAVDVDNNKLKLAKSFGATYAINPSEEDVCEKIREITGGDMCDFVIEGTGVAKLLNDSIYYLRNAGRLVLMSSHEKPCREFDFRPAIERGITISIAHPCSSSDVKDDMKRAVRLINSDAFKSEALISHRFSLSEINEAFETLENKPDGYIKGIIVPEEG